MNEFEDKLNALLSDPNQMERFASFAKSVMGGDTQAESLMPEDGMMKRLGELLKGADAKSSNDVRLLEAMRPYLSEKRRDKMDKAMKLARLAQLAELASNDFGGGQDV